MNAYSCAFFSIDYDKEADFMLFTWHEKSAEMTENQYFNELTVFVDLLHAHQPAYILTDLRTMFFAIPPDMQDQTNASLVPTLIKGGNKKSAFLVSQDLFSQISVEQAVEDIHQQSTPVPFQTRFFDKMEEAKQWLFD